MSAHSCPPWRRLLSLSLILCVWMGSPAAQTLEVPIPGKESILRVGALPDQVSDRGRAIAQKIMDGLERKDNGTFIEARAELEAIMGKENLGGSYSALHWMLGILLEPNEQKKAAFIKNPLDQSYVDFFFSNDFALLKEYLQRKYGVNNYVPDDPENHMTRNQFLEDMVIFNNPARSTWDTVEEVMDAIKKLGPSVKRIVDVGAGFGFYSHRFANLLGAGGIVYAVDISESYIDQLTKFLASYPLGNILPLLSKEDDINVSQNVDLVFISSLYHVLYSWSQHAKRNPFLKSVKKTLRDNGYLVILDNNFNAGLELHDSYIEKDFVVAQLYFYGFELLEYQRLSEARYMLIFQKRASNRIDAPLFAQAEGKERIAIADSRSAVHVGSLDSFDITPAGVRAAEFLLSALEGSDPEGARSAIAIYDAIIPTENFGGEYTALRWVAKYLTASEEARKEMTKEPLAAEFLAFSSEKDFDQLKLYLTRKYKLGEVKISVEEAVDEETRKIGIVERQSLEDFILFNNPERESWEKSSAILERLPLKSGDTILDVGSGAGYFTFKFSDIVGKDGKVYALDTKKPHVDYIESLVKKWGKSNVTPVMSYPDNLGLDIEGEADVVFMCSLYHIIYAVSSVHERDGMLKGIHQALKPGGKLVIVDNGPVAEEQLPYHGPYIRKELIEAQLAEYGFVLDQAHQIIPQRYMLVFRRSE